MRRRGAAIEGDFYRERAPRGQIFRHRRRDEGRVGEKSDQETCLLGISVNVQEILPDKDLPSGVKQPQASFCGHLVKKAAVFFISEFGAAGLLIAKRKVVVAVNTGEVAAPGDLNGAIDRNPLCDNAVVNAKAPVLVALGFHVPPCYHTTESPVKSA
jgi:hypothetical protein